MAHPRRTRPLLLLALATALVASVLGLAPPAAAAATVDRVDAFGYATDHGSPTAAPSDRAVGVAAHPGHGYWTTTSQGAVESFGGAPFHGSLGGRALTRPIVGMAARPKGDGYWLVASDGGVFAFGAAGFHGSTGGTALNQPIVGMATTRSGDGYWLVARDGGIFSFGDARFHGSTGDRRLNQPIVGMAGDPETGGYWLAAADGGVFAFGAPFEGSAGGSPLRAPVVAIVAEGAGRGYWLAAADGGIFTYGGAPFFGSSAGAQTAERVTSMAVMAGTAGYWLLRSPAPTPPRPSVGPGVPGGSGAGRRIVYSNPGQRVWLVEDDGSFTTYAVSGRRNVPPAGTYSVFSKSRVAYAGHDGITMRNMVRFTRGQNLAIGFHSIPRDASGRPLQGEHELGGYRSAGCVRQADSDSEVLWDFAPVGTKVVVVY